MQPQEKLKYTLEEYFELEKSSDEKFEYFDGNVFTMSGVSEAHAQIEVNLLTLLTNEFRRQKKSCRVFPANMRVKVPIYPPYRYPDLSALCGAARFEKIGGVDTLLNPSLIIEVLSDSTESFDRGDKFTYYKSIESFSEYLLIAQHRPHITQYIKQSPVDWNYKETNGLDAKVYLASLDCELTFAELYQDVVFPSNVFPFNFEQFSE